MKIYTEFNIDSQKYEMAGVWLENGVEKKKYVEVDWNHSKNSFSLAKAFTDAVNKVLGK